MGLRCNAWKKFRLYFVLDLDECKLKINLCDSNARCININGSYICQCDDGYSGDGFHCLGTHSYIAIGVYGRN